MSKKQYDAVALFSAGLDSILAAKVIEAQGLKVKCLHFISPFFGHPNKIGFFKRAYGLDVTAVDIGDEYVQMMLSGPKYGFGKYFNPCVDCKILMITKARELMKKYGAKFIITGEVVGQRPMSQRKDAMNSVRNESESREVLLRPLCARRMDPTPVEESGLVDRERLLDLWGRGRTRQLELAEEYGIDPIPTPAGGCLLTEQSSAKRYGRIFELVENPKAALFHLANHGRQYWSGTHWLAIGRNMKSNERLGKQILPGDLVFDVKDIPGPLAVGRQISDPWEEDAILDAAAFMASFSPRARKAGVPVDVIITQDDTQRTVTVEPSRETPMAWKDAQWKDAIPIRNKMDTKPR